MDNGGRNYNQDGRTDATTDIGGNEYSDGGEIWRNDESARNNASGISGSKEQSIKSDVIVRTSERNDTGATLPTGYYFTPNGNVERIPDGSYIKNGRLVRARRRTNGNDRNSSADGNAHRNRSKASDGEETLASDSVVWELDEEKPLKVKGKRKSRVVKDESKKLSAVTLIASTVSVLFTSISLLTKHDHWQLVEEEAVKLSEALNDVLNTLPAKYYDKITGILENWLPWIHLAFVASAIIIPRLQESAKRIEATNYKSRKNPDAGNARGTEDNPFDTYTSLGYNQG